MKDRIVYQHKKTQKKVLPLVVAFSVGYFVFSGICLASLDFLLASFFFLVGVITLVLLKQLYDESGEVVIVEDEGIIALTRKIPKEKFYLWDEFSFAYSCFNQKAHEFIILSPREMSENELKKVLRKRLVFDDLLIIHMEVMLNFGQAEQAKAFKKVIDERYTITKKTLYLTK